MRLQSQNRYNIYYMNNKYTATPLSFDEWCVKSDVKDKYKEFIDVYDDTSVALNDYKEYYYNEYLKRFKIHGKNTLTWEEL